MVAIPLQLPAAGERGQMEADPLPVTELKCQSTDGLWLLTSQAVRDGGYWHFACPWNLPDMEVEQAGVTLGWLCSAVPLPTM